MYPKELLNPILQILLLSCLSRKNRMYGYEMIRELKNAYGRKIDPNDGWVNTQLKKLETEGFATSEVVTVAGMKRRYFSMTPAGTGFYKERLEELSSFLVLTGTFLAITQPAPPLNYTEEYQVCLN